MMKRIIYLGLSLLLALSLSACLNLEETLTLNSDGSGSLVTEMDMSGLLSNPFMQMAMKEEMEKNGETMPERIDSTMDLVSELIPLNPQWTAEDIALARTVDARMVIDMEAAEGGIVVTMPFENLEQLMRLQKLMAEAKQPAKDGEEEGNPFSGLTSGGGNTLSTYVWKKGRLDRTTKLNLGDMDALAEGEEMDMMKMMMGDAKMIFRMKFPGTIKKVKGYPGHSIEEGNTLVQEFGFLDMFDDQEKINAGLQGQVKYKNN